MSSWGALPQKRIIHFSLARVGWFLSCASGNTTPVSLIFSPVAMWGHPRRHPGRMNLQKAFGIWKWPTPGLKACRPGRITASPWPERSSTCTATLRAIPIVRKSALINFGMFTFQEARAGWSNFAPWNRYPDRIGHHPSRCSGERSPRICSKILLPHHCVIFRIPSTIDFFSLRFSGPILSRFWIRCATGDLSSTRKYFVPSMSGDFRIC